MAKKASLKAKGAKKSKIVNIKLTPQQRQAINRKKQHIRYIKEVYTAAGFSHIHEMSNADFIFKGRKCDFDDVFITENVLVLVEHTSNNEDNVSDHLINKKIVFDYIHEDQEGFFDYLIGNFPAFAKAVKPVYQNHHYQIRIVYSSLNALKKSTKDHLQYVCFLDFPYLRYFKTLTGIVKLSSKYEMLDFLNVPASSFSDNALSPSSSMNSSFDGSVLPESQSHFPPNYKVVSFYISAGDLIKRAYVLRRDSWRENSNIYQRLLGKTKIEGIRKHLLDKKGVAINNIIVTLPDSTKVLGIDKKQIDTNAIKKVQIAKIELPVEYNSIGLIDGQHRAFSYYEGGNNENEISVLRSQQNLLVTGVIFPQNTDNLTRDRFSASLFLQINSNQTKVRPELIQEIGVILKPFAVQSIARRVLRGLSDHGPFAGHFETAFSEGSKIKTATVVNYALAPLVRPAGTESLFNVWQSENKDKLAQGNNGVTTDESVVEEYAEFCVKQINTFSGAIRISAKSRWTTDKTVINRMLTTVIVNGILHCLRRICAADKLGIAETYKLAMAEIEEFNFANYGSNRYNQLGQDLALKYFNIPKTDD